VAIRGSSALPITFGVSSTGTPKAYAASSIAISFNASSAGVGAITVGMFDGPSPSSSSYDEPSPIGAMYDAPTPS
jgi:hypothetical protein